VKKNPAKFYPDPRRKRTTTSLQDEQWHEISSWFRNLSNSL